MSSPIRKTWKIPTKEEERELLRQAQAGDLEARNELVTRNLPFVIKAATEYWNYRPVGWMEMDDFVQAAAMGLMHAIERWDFQKAQGRFIAYAKHWIRHYIDREVHYSQAYRVPIGTQFAIKKGKSSEEVMSAATRFKEMTYIEMHGESEDLNGALLDNSDVFADTALKEELGLLQEQIDALPVEERNLLKRRFQGNTLEVMGKQLGCTRERVRQRLQKITDILTEKMHELLPEEVC